MIKKFRSSCIIASALDLIGDKWSLLIIRDMLLQHKKTYKEIAELLGISKKAVEKRMSKALSHLIKDKINLKK